MTAVEDHARRLLLELSIRGDRRQDLSPDASVLIRYTALPRSRSAIDDFHAGLTLAERQGAVKLTWGKGASEHLVQRIVLRDADKLADLLGVDRLPTRAALMADAVRAAVPLDGHLEELLAGCVKRWERGEAAWAMPLGEPDKAIVRFRLLNGLLGDEARGRDRRTFSTMVAGNSKLFEQHQGMLAAMLHAVRDDLPESDESLFAYLGLQKFSHPVYLSGQVKIDFAILDLDGVLYGSTPPFIAVDEYWVPGLVWTTETPVVLTIENLASFNRHVREVREEGCCVVYTGGFPSAAVVSVLKRLRDGHGGTRFSHWGDIDFGGLRILAFLEECLGVDISLHLMSVELAERLGRPNSLACRQAAPAILPPPGRAGSDLLQYLNAGGNLLEQEVVTPQAICAG